MKISLVIRSLNEKESLRDLLSDVASQKRMPDEVIVVDNESSDGTPELAREWGAKVITLARDQFSHPKSMNLGVGEAKGDVVVLTVGHARIPRKDFFATAERVFVDPRVAGLYSPVLPKKPYSFVEFISYIWPYMWARFAGPYAVEHSSMGVLGATNAAIRKSLWEQHPFDEAYGMGGEDSAWAAWALADHHKIVCDWHFCVRHSHHLGWKEFRQQVRQWRKMAYPSPFSRDALKYRKDLKL